MCLVQSHQGVESPLPNQKSLILSQWDDFFLPSWDSCSILRAHDIYDSHYNITHLATKRTALLFITPPSTLSLWCHVLLSISCHIMCMSKEDVHHHLPTHMSLEDTSVLYSDPAQIPFHSAVCPPLCFCVLWYCLQLRPSEACSWAPEAATRTSTYAELQVQECLWVSLLPIPSPPSRNDWLVQG